MKLKSQTIHALQQRETQRQAREVGQFSCAKMRASYLIENKNALSPALRELLEASLTLRTTSTKKLAAHLHRSPATIRAGFQQILAILGEQNR